MPFPVTELASPDAIARYETAIGLEVHVQFAELSQRWRPSADTVFFNRGNFFVVVKWQAAERGALETSIRELRDGWVRRIRPSRAEAALDPRTCYI
jgi:hypothetical protein